jgi:hypothetical protein
MAIGTTYFALENRVMVRQLEFCAHFQVALKTGIRGFSRIDDGVRAAATLYMQTSWSMA